MTTRTQPKEDEDVVVYVGGPRPFADTPLTPNRADIERHLFELFTPSFVHPYPDAWIEIAYGDPATGGNPDRAEHFSAFELRKAAGFAESKNKDGFNIYVSVALRRGETDSQSRGRASGSHVVTSSYSWNDFDKEGDAARVDAILKENGLRPAMVVETGYTPHLRFHPYFKLKGHASADQLRDANTALNTLLSGDKVQNPDRIMRLAGTVNYPTKDKQQRGYIPELVTLRIHTDAPSYTVEHLTTLARPTTERQRVSPMPEWLAKLVAVDKGKGTSLSPSDSPESASPEKIKAALATINPDINRSAWFDIGCGLYTDLGDEEGFARWVDWSRRGRKYKAKEMRGQWRSIVKKDGYSTSAATIFWYADEADPSWRDRYREQYGMEAESNDRDEPPDNPPPPPTAEPNRPAPPEQSSSTADQQPPPNRPVSNKPYVLVRASDVVPRPRHWLWQGHLLRGALELLTGVPGVGKSQLQCDLVARATTGEEWPDHITGSVPINVIMVTAEDALDQEVVPRLIAAKADLTRVQILKSIKKDRKERMFLLAEDLTTLAQIIDEIGDVGLVTLDPITAYMGKVDSHRATDVRGQLGPLAALAEDKDVALSAITHPAKASSQKAIDHFIGSQAFIAAARIGHLCIEELDEEQKPTGRVLFANAKNNPHLKMPTLAYRIAQVVVGQDEQTHETIHAPHVVWDQEAVTMTADQAIAATTAKGKDEATKLLEQLLARGPVPVKTIKEHAEGHGLSMKQMHDAKAKLRTVVAVKEGMEGGWSWKYAL